MRISVCTISKNEERDIIGFLENIVDFADEIIIIDDDSNDKTKEIALSYGKKIRFIENKMTTKDFASQRNISIANANGDWLIHMDIDERISKMLKEDILKNMGNPNIKAFKHRRLNFFLNHKMKGGGFQSWNKIQIARNGIHHFTNKIHENCIVDCNKDQILQLNGYMYHLTDDNYEERIDKSNTYVNMIVENLSNEGKQINKCDILFKPILKFITRFFIQKGFRDGIYGLIWALHCSIADFKVYTILWLKQNKLNRKKLDSDLSKK
jgi:glycosyltransferase involved in cell wall biosynthesis